MSTDPNRRSFNQITETPVEWCRVQGLGVGDRLEVHVLHPKEWVEVAITALGDEAIMVRLAGCREWLVGAGTTVRLPTSRKTALAGPPAADLAQGQAGLPAGGPEGPGGPAGAGKEGR